jgi:hypothetical protein
MVEDKDLFGSLPIGTAIVRLQGRGAGPFLVQIPEFKIAKGSVTDHDVRDWMAGQARANSGTFRPCGDPTVSHASQPVPISAPSTSGTDAAVRAFLLDVVAHPDSGIAGRFKRLGISVRQGQKLKFRLLEAGLIEDHEELTRTGRLRKIQLTAKGRGFLSTNSPK